MEREDFSKVVLWQSTDDWQNIIRMTALNCEGDWQSPPQLSAISTFYLVKKSQVTL